MKSVFQSFEWKNVSGNFNSFITENNAFSGARLSNSKAPQIVSEENELSKCSTLGNFIDVRTISLTMLN